MKRFLISLLVFFPSFIHAQTALEYAVRLEATVHATPPHSITLHWDAGTGATSFNLYRKKPDQNAWMISFGILPAGSTSYTDTNVVYGQAYDYKIVKVTTGYTGYGYIMTGMNIPAVEDRGRVILLADSLLDNQLAAEILALRATLTADGWEVLYHGISPSDSVKHVKNIIKADYQADPGRTRAVFLLGHIPVPYSGLLNPDGHSNHYGAWPTDTYYGDMNGTWTDLYANNVSASSSRNHNVPGDGKFDQTFIPSAMELAVGRVDLFDLPAFSKTYIELTRDYINKDIAFRKASFVPQQRAIIDDNFGGFNGEAFASSGWKSFSPLVGIQQVSAGDYRTSMDTGTYIWSYGCGGGSYTSAGGIGNTANFAGDSLQGVFSCLFGSYFGDWDVSNNFLRAVLAQGTILTNAWSGRPHWYFHRMGLGMTIGACDLLTANEVGNYYYSPYASHFVSINLMGDPTLTQYIVSPPGPATATTTSAGTDLHWMASSDSVLGYYVFRSASEQGPFQNISSPVIIDTFFTDACLPDSGQWFYLVRALKLQKTPSGTFYNLSMGSAADATFNGSMAVQADFTASIAGSKVSFSNSSSNATHYQWYFGDGNDTQLSNPVHTYAANGTYQVVLWASNDCFMDSSMMNIQITAAGIPDPSSERFIVFPNPAKNYFEVEYESNTSPLIRWELMNPEGQIVLSKSANTSFEMDCSRIPAGLYILKGSVDKLLIQQKIMIAH